MITVGENAFISIEGADTYFATRANSSDWDALGDPVKEQLLITAAEMLNEILWVGVATSDNQTLAFPRTGNYYDPVLGKVLELDSDSIPIRIAKANCEQAYHLLINPDLLNSSGGFSAIKIDTISLEGLDKGSAQVPIMSSSAESYYSPLSLVGCNKLIRQLNNASRSWWRAN